MKRLIITVLAACSHAAPTPQQPAEPAMHDHHDAHAHHDNHAHHGPMVHRFEKAEDWVARFDDPARDEWQKPDAVVAALALSPGMSVADVGAGTGYFEGRLAKAVGATGKVLAVDVEPDMVRYIGERAKREGWTNVQGIVGQPDDPKLGPASVDRILVVDVWHHIEARAAYAQKLVAALKPGGFVVIVDFTQETEKGPPKDHRLTPEVITADLTGAGLRVSTVAAGLPDQFVLKGERAP